MARVATIIARIFDHWGDEWDVREYRPTKHGFSIALGWPHGHPRGRGGGGVRTIVTTELSAHFEKYRRAPIDLALPIGNSTIKRIRRLLGHHHQVDTAAWWEERAPDLSDLTLDQFALKHSVSTGAAANARHAVFGRQLRPAGWWRRSDVACILLSNLPRTEIADALDISVGSVGRLRWALKSAKPSPLGKRKRGGTLQHPDMDKAVEMVRSGANYSVAARLCGFTPAGVAVACRRAGVLSPRVHPKRR